MPKRIVVVIALKKLKTTNIARCLQEEFSLERGMNDNHICIGGYE